MLPFTCRAKPASDLARGVRLAHACSLHNYPGHQCSVSATCSETHLHQSSSKIYANGAAMHMGDLAHCLCVAEALCNSVFENLPSDIVIKDISGKAAQQLRLSNP